MSDEVIHGLSAESKRIPSKWNRSTVADGSWLQKYTLSPLSARDYYLASAIDALGSATDDNISALSAAISSVSAIHDDKISGLSSSIVYVSGAIDAVGSALDTSAQVLELAINNEISTRINETQYLSAAITAEQETRQESVSGLQNQIDTINAATDVIDVYGSWSDFTANSGNLFTTSAITDNDIIKVINDPNVYQPDLTAGGSHQTYHRWIISATHPHTAKPLDPTEGYWDFIGYTDPYYNIAEINDIVENLSATISDNYLSANGIAVQSGHNIVITKPDGDNTPHIKIETSSHVTFDGISSTNLSATNASGENLKYDNVTAVNLSSNKVSATNLSATTISASELSATKLSASELSAITLSASTAYGQSAKFTDISATNLTALTASGNEAIFTNISAQNISGDNFNTDNIIAKNISATESFSGNVLTLSNSALIPGISSTNISSVNISSSNVTALTAKGNSAIYNTYSGEYLIGISGDTNVTASIANLINSAANGGSMTGLKNASGIVLNFNPTQTILFTNSADTVNIYVSGGASNWIGFNYDDMNNAIAVTGDLSNILEDYMPKAWSGWNNSKFEGSARLAGSAFEAYSAGSADYATSASSAFSASRAFSAASAYSAYYATSAGTANSSLSAANAEKLGGNAPSYYMNTANINYNAGGKISGYGGTAFVGGLTALQAQNSVLTAEKIKITSGNGIDVVPTGTDEIIVRANKGLISSACSGQSAYNWITGTSATLSAGEGIGFVSAGPHILGITAEGAKYYDGNFIEVDNTNKKINLSSNISAHTITSDYLNMAIVDGGGGSNSIEYDAVTISAVSEGRGYHNTYSSTWVDIINASKGAYVPLSAIACEIGANNSANDDSFAQGANNYAETNSMAQGYYNSAYSNSFAQGSNNSAERNSFAWGTSNTAAHDSITMGKHLITKPGQIALGWYGKANTAAANNVIFAIGNGTSTNDRSDAFTLASNGMINSYDTEGKSVFRASRESIVANNLKMPIPLTRGLSVDTTTTAVTLNVPGDVESQNYLIFGADGGHVNLWIGNNVQSNTFTLTKAASVSGQNTGDAYGTYRLAVGVQSGYTIIFKNFATPTANRTDVYQDTSTVPYPLNRQSPYYDTSFYTDPVNLNTHFYFHRVPVEDTIRFTIDNDAKIVAFIKGGVY